MAPPKAPNENSMDIASPQLAYYALRSVGFDPNLAVQFVAIGMAESNGGDRTAVGRAVPERPDYGYWQINYIHKDKLPSDFFPPGQRWFNILDNAKAVKMVYDMQGKGAWVQFKNGAFGRFLGVAQQAGTEGESNIQSGKVKVDNVDGLSGTPWGALGDSASTAVSLTGDAIGDFLGANKEQLAKAAWIGGGSILVLLGILLLAKSQLTGTVGKVLKGVAK